MRGQPATEGRPETIEETADAHERFQLLMRYCQVHLDPARAAETARIAASLDVG